ncbi:MAG TPA: hypothetical protein PLL36_12265, partial [Candidatus Hydrogenedentes bacterium]|nr:hypothetical protein [Candidatus Hydrogenedentota bacterium]
MKRNLAVLAALLMALSIVAGAFAQEAQPEVQQNAETLVVGHTTMMNGNFFSELWGNNTADIDVRSLIHEYPLIAWTNNEE